MVLIKENDSLEQLSSENAYNFVCVRNVCMYLPPKKSNVCCWVDRHCVFCDDILSNSRCVGARNAVYAKPVSIIVPFNRYAGMIIEIYGTQTHLCQPYYNHDRWSVPIEN